MVNCSLFCLNICESVANSQTSCDVIPDITKRMKIFFTSFTVQKHILYTIKLDKVAIE